MRKADSGRNESEFKALIEFYNTLGCVRCQKIREVTFSDVMLLCKLKSKPETQACP